MIELGFEQKSRIYVLGNYTVPPLCLQLENEKLYACVCLRDVGGLKIEKE